MLTQRDYLMRQQKKWEISLGGSGKAVEIVDF